MSMTYSDIWHTNNVDKVIEMVADAETMEFSQADFDRVERELFSLEYDRVRGRMYDLEQKLKTATDALELADVISKIVKDKTMSSSLYDRCVMYDEKRQALNKIEGE